MGVCLSILSSYKNDNTGRTGQELCIMFLDFAKAFSSIAHSAFEAVCKRGAGKGFTALIEDLYRRGDLGTLCPYLQAFVRDVPSVGSLLTSS